MRDGNDLDQPGNCRHGEKWSESRYSMKIILTCLHLEEEGKTEEWKIIPSFWRPNNPVKNNFQGECDQLGQVQLIGQIR